VSEFARAAEGHRRELLIHCYRMLGSFPDAEDAVQETLLRAWRYRDTLKEGAPLRPWLYRIATNACLDAIARDERRAVLAAKAAADGGNDGTLEDVVWLGPIPDSVLELPTPTANTPEAITLTRETIEIAYLTVIQLLTPQQRAVLILCDVCWIGPPKRPPTCSKSACRQSTAHYSGRGTGSASGCRHASRRGRPASVASARMMASNARKSAASPASTYFFSRSCSAALTSFSG